jgi:hypothetical protein
MSLETGSGRDLGTRLIGVFGVSLITGGVFIANAAFGFPPGAPAGAPEDLSWHGIVHAIAPAVGFLSLIAGSFVFARRFAGLGQRGWAVVCAATGVVVLVLSAWPNLGGTQRGGSGPCGSRCFWASDGPQRSQAG